MSERMTSGPFEFDQNQVDAVREVGQLALEISQDRYCSGYPHYQGGRIRRLGYNNARHNFYVGNDAARLAGVLGFNSSEQALACATGYTHDIVQLKGRGTDERESAEWIEEQLVNKRILPIAAAKLASKAIIGTEPLFDEDGPIHGKVIGQTAQYLDYNSKYEELFVKGVACADLGELYTPMSPYLGHMLYAQRQELDVSEVPDTSDLLDFQGKQVSFMETYRYPLAEAEGVFATHRQQVTDYTHFVYQQLQEGRIESWGHLLHQDQVFMGNPDMVLR